MREVPPSRRIFQRYLHRATGQKRKEVRELPGGRGDMEWAFTRPDDPGCSWGGGSSGSESSEGKQ